MDETIVYEGGNGRSNRDRNPGQAAVATGSSAYSSGPSRIPSGRFTFASGDRPLDGYTIKRAVGRGGFSEVYYALSDAGKEVALKHITRNVDVERRGVMQCMNLKSPHLITIHDLRSNDEGDTFVIMEYVAGPNLSSVLERYPNGMPLPEVRMWLNGLVDGVTYLHEHGIVHRDLKPANLFLEEGVVKIGDYGLSKTMTGSKEPGHSQSVGTCHYMAPEIGTGKYHKPIDIYAIGIILYELILGRVPFDGESVQEVLMKHLTARPDLSLLPEPYRTIIGRALAKDPTLRPQNVADLLPGAEAGNRPDVRFIPDNHAEAAWGTVSPAASRPVDPPAPAQRSGPAEEPIFYIGPDTMPPAPAAPRDRLGRIRGFLAGNPVAQAARASNPAPPRTRPATPARGLLRRAAALIEPPAPPPLPSPRLRVAELSGSMLLASVISAAATVLCLPLLDATTKAHVIRNDPFQLFLLFSLILGGSWAVMIPAKLWESHPVSNGTRRLTYVLCGALLGSLAGLVVQYLNADAPGAGLQGLGRSRVLVQEASGYRGVVNLPLALASFFGVAMAVPRLWKLTERGRKARFRLWPVLVMGFVSLLAAEWSNAPLAGVALAATMIPGVVQLASPWSREAAAYARYAETMRFDRKKKAA